MSMTQSHKQRGFMAIVLIVFLVVFVAIAASIVSMTTSGTRTAADHVQASAALFMAESGLEWAAREMFGVDDPQDECEALDGASSNVNDSGTFTITAAQYLDGDDGEVCRVTSVGAVGSTSRTITASVRIITGDGEVGSIFDDSTLWEDSDFPGFADDPFRPDGVLHLNRNNGCSGPDSFVATDTAANISEILEPGFDGTDTVYFAFNVVDVQSAPSCSPGDSRLRITVTHSGGSVIQCNWFMLAGTTDCPPGAGAGSLVDAYDTVVELGIGFASSSVEEIEIRTIWDSGVQWIELADACIGPQSWCAPNDDPVVAGSWDENP